METSKAGAPSNLSDGRIVLRNTMYLGAAEVLILPITIFLNAMIGRYLGPEDMGHIYLAGTITGCAFLAINWGQGGSLPALVVLDRESAGSYLGSSATWRLGAGLLVYGLVVVGSHYFGLSERQQWATGLVFLTTMLGSLLIGCQDVIRGFERTDIASVARVGSQLLTVSLVVPVLMIGGRLRATLLAQATAVAVVLLMTARTMRSVGVGRPHWNTEHWKKLMAGGTPFVFFGLALALQPNVDAFYLAKLTTPEVVGWYAVGQKLLGFLLVPATTLIGALYPTLCRLYAHDREGYAETARNAVSAVGLLAVPVALGCALYADVGVSIFGRQAFRPAEDTLRFFSGFLFLVYFSMPVGTALSAAGKQVPWACVQLLCVANSALLDPLLISYFQKNYGNGGMGLALASTLSESIMLSTGMFLMPRGVFGWKLFKTVLLTLLAGAGMVAAGLALRWLPSLVAAPISIAVYAAGIVFTGAITREQTAAVAGFVRRKVLRKSA